MNSCKNREKDLVRTVENFLGLAVPDDYDFSPDERIAYYSKEELHGLVLEREPYFMIDRAVRVNDGNVLAKAHISIDQCKGHFPGRAVVPLILMCEVIAQSGCIIAALGGNVGEVPVATGAGGSNLIWKTFLEPPVDLLIEAKKIKEKFGTFFIIDGKVRFEGRCVAELTRMKYMLVSREKVYHNRH